MFTSEIFTTISQIHEEPPEVIRKYKRNALKRIDYIGLKHALLLFLNTKITKENNLEVFKQAYRINVVFYQIT